MFYQTPKFKLPSLDELARRSQELTEQMQRLHKPQSEIEMVKGDDGSYVRKA